MFFEDSFMRKKPFSVFFGQRAEILRLWKQYSTCHEKLSNEVFLGKKCEFFSFLFIELTLQFFCQRISHRIVKGESYVSTGNLGRNIFFLKKTLAALIVFGSERKNFGLLAKLLGRVVQTVFDLSMGSIWDFFLENKLRYILAFSHTEQTLFGIQSKIFQQSCQKNYLKFQSLPDIERKVFFSFVGKFAAVLPKLHSTCLQEQFEWNFFLKNSLQFLYIMRTLSEKILAFYQFFFEGVVRSVFYISTGTFRRKKFSIILSRLSSRFRNMTGKKFGFPSNFFSAVLKNCILCLNRYNLRQAFRQKTFFCQFWATNKNFLMVKLAYYMPRWTF